MFRKFATQYFLLALIIQSCSLFAQNNQITIKGKIIDETGASLPYARVSELQSKISTLTNQRGTFYLNVPAEKAHLKISYIGYNSIDTTLYFGSKSNDTVFCTFKMIPSSKEFAVVNVSSKPYQQVYETTNLNILDYTFFGQNILLLVSFKGDYQIRLMDQSEKLLTKQNLSFKPSGFIKDCLGILHVFSKDSLYPVHFNSEQFSFPDAIPILDYIEFIEPCVASTDDFFFLQNITNFNQTIEYISQRKKDDYYNLIRLINDAEKTEDVLAYAEELQMTYAPSMMSEIFTFKDVRAAREKMQDQYFFDLVVTKATYAPLIKTASAVYVFDHLADSCFVFSLQSEPLRQFKINYHSRPDWANKLVLEDGSDRIFAVHSLNGIYSLSEINLETGELKAALTLTEHTYPERIKIRNGWVYYLHHDLQNAGFDKLFRVAIGRD
jgi:hypothetical protein